MFFNFHNSKQLVVEWQCVFLQLLHPVKLLIKLLNCNACSVHVMKKKHVFLIIPQNQPPGDQDEPEPWEKN